MRVRQCPEWSDVAGQEDEGAIVPGLGGVPTGSRPERRRRRDAAASASVNPAGKPVVSVAEGTRAVLAGNAALTRVTMAWLYQREPRYRRPGPRQGRSPIAPACAMIEG